MLYNLFSIHFNVVTFLLVITIGSAIMGCGNPPIKPDTPDKAIEELFMAMKQGDSERIYKVCTGKVAEVYTLKEADDLKSFKMLGRVFIGVEEVNVEGENATAILLLNSNKILTSDEIERLNLLSGLLSAMEKIRTFVRTEDVSITLADLKKGVVRFKVKLIKQGDYWLIEDIK